MVLSLSTLKPATGAIKKSKRVGRGNGSGHGTSACRGTKGQKSRSGVSNLKRLGLKKMLLSVPKTRGFKSAYAKSQAVNLGDISEAFSQGALVSPATLLQVGLIANTNAPVKILASGNLKVAELNFKGVAVSKAAEKAIIDNKGTINK